MPDELGSRLDLDDVCSIAVFLVEQQQRDIGCVLGIQREVDTAGLYRCSERIVLSRTRIESFLRA